MITTFKGAKFWLEPVALARNFEFRAHELNYYQLDTGLLWVSLGL